MKFKQISTTFFHHKHRRLCLSSIIVLFLFASTVSGYFLVKNSQDLRRAASDPYASTCFCDYGGNCDRGGNLPCDGGCSAGCNPPGVCCKQPAAVACEPGERQCTGTYMGRYCSPTSHKWVDFTCPNNGKCTGAGICTTPSPTPIPLPTANPGLSCSANGGQCMSVNCASVYMQSIAGTCTNPAYNCCKTIQQFACDAGAQECVNSTTRRYCNSERTAWITAVCPSGSTCQKGTCIFPPTPTSPVNCAGTNQSCQSKACCNASDVCETVYGGKFCITKGTECTSGQQKCVAEGSVSYIYKCSSGGYYQKEKRCDFGCSGNACKSACTPGAKRCSSDAKAIETCSNDGSGWSKQSCSSNYSCNSQTVTCVSTNPTCQGTCYTNSSCTVIGKVPATGTCLYSTSVCCAEVDALANSGLKANGENCSSDSECQSGYCYDNSIMTIKDPGMITFSVSRCQPYPLQTHLDATMQANKAAAVMTTMALSFVPGVGPVIQVISAGVQGVQAVYTCNELAQIKNDPSIDQAMKDQFSRACVTSSISAVTGLIGGSSTMALQIGGNALSGTSQLALGGLGLVDNLGGVLVSSMNVNNVCKLYGSNSSQCLLAVGGAGISVGSATLSAYQFANRVNITRLSTLTNDPIEDPNHLIQQMLGNKPSEAIDQVTKLTIQKIAQGMKKEEAIAQAVSESLTYWEGPIKSNPGNSVYSFEKVLECDGVICKQYAQLATGVAIKLGEDVDFAMFSMSSEAGLEHHAVTLLKHADGSFGVIDPTNPHFTSANIHDYVEIVNDHGYTFTTAIGGAIHGYNFQPSPSLP